MNKVTIICNVPHNITEGSCALCERDNAIKDARRYRTLRAMVGVLNVELGRITGVNEHATPENIRIQLDAELDQRFRHTSMPKATGEQS